MITVATGSLLFALSYVLPGIALTSDRSGLKRRTVDRIALVVFLSLIFGPLTFSLLSLFFPGRDTHLLFGYVLLWTAGLAAARRYGPAFRRWVPDFSALPGSDRPAFIAAVLLTAVVASLRVAALQGYEPLVRDDFFHLAKVTSIATSGLPSLYARQPLYPFVFYDLDYILPGLWVRFTGGAVGVLWAWVVHTGVQTFAASFFLARLVYMFAETRMTRLFGLLALLATTGLDIFLLPFVEKRLYIDQWPLVLGWFDGPVHLSMPLNLFVWVPQHALGMAIAGLIGYLTVGRPKEGPYHFVFVALLLAALFKTSAFVFAGFAPGYVLWHLYDLQKRHDRKRRFLTLAGAALVAFLLILPSLAAVQSKLGIFAFGLRSFTFLDIPFLEYPISLLVFLMLELGILLPLLLWGLAYPGRLSRATRFWVFQSCCLLVPFIVQTPLYNDVGMRGAVAGQLAAALVGCHVLTQLERRSRNLMVGILGFHIVLASVTAGTELSFRFRMESAEPAPATTRWIAKNAPLNALVFYDLETAGAGGDADLIEVTYGQRMSYTRKLIASENHFVPFSSGSWRCLPEVDLGNADSLCSIEELVSGDQSVYTVFSTPAPDLNSAAFKQVFKTEERSIYSLACTGAEPEKIPAQAKWKTQCGESAWTLSQPLEDMRVDYDGGIVLEEIERHDAGGGGLVLHWRTPPGTEVDYAISLRLYNAKEEGVYQQDAILWNLRVGKTSQGANTGSFTSLVLFDYPDVERYFGFDQTVALNLPKDLAPGEYGLRVVVYDVDTLQPTVELGTWSPEAQLALLRYSPD